MTSSGETSPLAMTPTTSAGSTAQTPKFGTLIPNRVFVGGIPANTQEHDLKVFFSQFGAVKDCKIIVDRSGVSKGSYGFVTFETLEDAEKIIKKEGDNLVFQGRKLNIGPAIRKQQTFPRMDLAHSAIYFSNGIPYTYQNGMAVFHSDYPHLPAQPQPAATYPGLAVQPQAGYIPYVQTSPPAAAPASWAGATSQWRWTPQSPSAAAVGTQPYLYPAAAMQQSPGVPEMAAMYQPHYITPGEMSELEASAAAAAAAEGSMAMEPSMYADKVAKTVPPIADAKTLHPLNTISSPPSLASVASSPIASTSGTPIFSSRASSIVYGKRAGAALVAPPRKMMSTPHCSVLYSPRLTPTPPYYKYERAMTNCRALSGGHLAASTDPFTAAAQNLMNTNPLLIPLTPPQTPDVK